MVQLLGLFLCVFSALVVLGACLSVAWWILECMLCLPWRWLLVYVYVLFYALAVYALSAQAVYALSALAVALGVCALLCVALLQQQQQCCLLNAAKHLLN